MMTILDVRYIGRSKERRPGDFSALGWMNNQWAIIFPEKVLRKHFNEENPAIEKTLYGVLGAPETASDTEIKTAYRRMALQWHPDKCREPNAAEVFMRIQEAYNILSNPTKRGKYDVGLAFEKQTRTSRDDWYGHDQKNTLTNDTFGYRTPLRCGLILCDGEQQGKWFVVSKIHQWADITNNNGQTLVPSWVYGENAPREVWS